MRYRSELSLERSFEAGNLSRCTNAKGKTGILTNILLGIVGAFVANLLLGIVGITAEGTWLAQLVVGLLGACLLIWIWRAFKK